jgi:hypothetical protein
MLELPAWQQAIVAAAIIESDSPGRSGVRSTLQQRAYRSMPAQIPALTPMRHLHADFNYTKLKRFVDVL